MTANHSDMSDEQLQNAINNIKAEQKRRKEAKKWPVTTTVYAHRDKESNYQTASEIGLSESAAGDTFRYCAYEVELTLQVHEDGSSFATHIDGVAITDPVQMS